MAEQIFKWLMALVVMVCIPWLLESCKNLRRTDYKHSEEYLKERIQKIYANVTLFYNRLDTLRQNGEGAPTRWPDFDKLYCSADWNDKLSAVTALEEESDGKRVFFDWNYWTCAEDYSFMYASDVEVIDKTGNTGTASLTLHNGDMAVPVLLNMVFERGDWFIDEITNNWNRHPAYRYFEWKHEMEGFGG